MSQLKDFQKQFHENAVNKGFYDLPNGILDKMSIDLFSKEEIKAVKDAFIAQQLMLITSELGEALEANRNNLQANIGAVEESPIDDTVKFKELFERDIKNTFEDELSDVFIRLFDLVGWLNINLERHVYLKHAYNKTREKNAW